MAIFKTDIANLALGRLGLSSTITDLETDLSTEAKILKRHFRESLDFLLEQHHWNFARRSALLIKQFDDPEVNYNFSYFYPADALVIRQIAYKGHFIKNIEQYLDQKIPFNEVYFGSVRLLYTDLRDAHAEYTARVEENDIFPSHFGRALAAQLSLDIAPSLITSNFPKIKEALNNDAFNAVAAGISDDLARQPQFNNSDSTFVRARY